ncbi:cytochrome b-245 chaperone 1 homolog [Denticeps clupeoides]|uniref:Essential for reactive oxygen species protein n=1 Tax=Denticeps clupeoides TaxID=299321 RepID=A0AAY4AVI8_9TELE|nr:cytochrome b-245 chaperone 1 homolog [Denticeps clupeoides]XP_028826287.1 cytochrome b-245 chaperone 1 homolog [Denticeps clupeoides]
MYMLVEKHTYDLLHLKRVPGIRSWSLLVGITSVGLGAAYYSSDNLLWKSFYVTGCLFIALQNMEEWEDAVFDKARNVVELKTFSLYTLMLTLCRRGDEKVVLDMRHLRGVSVQEEKVRYLGKGYVLVLRLATGFSYPLTQNATLGGRSDVEATVSLLKSFLGLEELQQSWEDYGGDEALDEGEDGDVDDSSDSRDESER